MNLRKKGALGRVAPRCNVSIAWKALMRLGVLAAAAALAFGANAGAQESPADPPAEATAPASGYAIGSGDVLQVFVWKEPELTRDVTVRLDGKITVPLIGDIQAEGRTPSQLAADIETAFKRFIASPQVTLGVLETKSARFYVLGQVSRPGEYALPGRVTVLQGLALAGGFREYAKTDNIVIVRQEGNNEQIRAVDYDKLKDGKNLDQNIVLRPGDTILVP